jgi:hypothetical protein
MRFEASCEENVNHHGEIEDCTQTIIVVIALVGAMTFKSELIYESIVPPHVGSLIRVHDREVCRPCHSGYIGVFEIFRGYATGLPPKNWSSCCVSIRLD